MFQWYSKQGTSIRKLSYLLYRNSIFNEGT